MRPSSVLMGDMADLFQDSRIDDVATTARRASIQATVNSSQITQVAWRLEQKIGQLQWDNAVLGLLVEQLFTVLAEQQPERAAAILAAVKAAMSGPSEPDSIEPLKTALNLPKPRAPKVSSHPRPATKRARKTGTATRRSLATKADRAGATAAGVMRGGPEDAVWLATGVLRLLPNGRIDGYKEPAAGQVLSVCLHPGMPGVSSSLSLFVVAFPPARCKPSPPGPAPETVKPNTEGWLSPV